ncbi:MAG TPA: hypothetical protein VGL38_03240 [bacterium]
MRLRLLVTGLAMVCLVSLASAQYRNAPPSSDVSQYLRSNTSALGLKAIRGLFDPNRMHMTQSFSFGYASAGGHGVSQGMYMNTVDYRISNPLFLTTHLGYVFQPSSSPQWNTGLSNGFQNGNFVGGADLNWRPWSNTTFRLSVYRGMDSSPYYPDYGWGSFGYGSYFDRP